LLIGSVPIKQRLKIRQAQFSTHNITVLDKLINNIITLALQLFGSVIIQGLSGKQSHFIK
jgi:hypothetical protein